MPVVHFLPADRTVEVPAGTLIHEAAITAGLLSLELPCGGQGTCGLCVVEVMSAQQATASLVPACRTKVRDDMTVHLPDRQDVAMQVVGDSHFLVGDDLLPGTAALSPPFRYLSLHVPPATIEEHYSDWLRLTRALSQAGLSGPFSVGLEILRSLAAALREEDGRITIGLEYENAGARVIEVRAGQTIPQALGLAVDIGTTTIAAQLVDLGNGQVIGTATTYNQQIRRGADVISRIDYAKTAERQAELRQLVLDTINGLIAELTADFPRDMIRTVFLAGNTTMIHLLLALPPHHIRETPYVPTVNPVPVLAAGEIGFDVPPSVRVRCAPGVGSYVGGDITAGLLTTELPRNRDEIFLFMDIGTNGEIVIGNADWMVGCACSAGPAFEGSGIKCGMRAAAGAIEHLEIGADLDTLRYKVIGDGKPAGICGSGLICMVGELFLRGIVDQAGHFEGSGSSPRLVQTDSGLAFLVERASATASGEDLIITEADIGNLIRTKAAIYAACALVLQNVGLTWDAIARVYIAGGFGRFLNISDAILIGMLPDLPQARFRYIGNAALTGAYVALLSAEHRRMLDDIAAKITYVDLSSDTRYMDSYVQAMFLPHTDLTQFPTVADKLATRPPRRI